MTRLTSVVVGTGTSTTARAQSRERLTTLTICPLGTVTTSPSAERSRVIRSVTSSTVPRALVVAPVTEISTTSPKPYWRSVMMKKPARTSPTTRWAPNPSADAEHGGRRDQAGDRDAEDVEHEEGRDRVDQHDRRPGEHLGERVPVLGGLRAHQRVAAGGPRSIRSVTRAPIQATNRASRIEPRTTSTTSSPRPRHPDAEVGQRGDGQQVGGGCGAGMASSSAVTRGQRGSTNRACAERPTNPRRRAGRRSTGRRRVPPRWVAASMPSHSPARRAEQRRR